MGRSRPACCDATKRRRIPRALARLGPAAGAAVPGSRRGPSAGRGTRAGVGGRRGAAGGADHAHGRACGPAADRRRVGVLVLLIVFAWRCTSCSGLGLCSSGPRSRRGRWPAALSLADASDQRPGDADDGGGGRAERAVLLRVERTVAGKALRASAVNRVGARLVGIRPARTAVLAGGAHPAAA